MATYKKNNYRPNRGKKKEEEVEQIQNLEQIEKESTTAEVFNKLDEGASSLEKWIEKNTKYILIAVVSVLIIGVGYALYKQFVVNKNEEEASEKLSVALSYFDSAVNATEYNQRQTLFKEALEGKNGAMGLLAITKEYSGTNAANIANYSAGIAYLNTNKYKEAVEYLDKFKSSSDEILGALAFGNIADAFWQIKQPKDALSYYEKAISKSDNNSYTTPMYLAKAGDVATEIKDYNKAISFYERIISEFPESEQLRQAQIQLSRVQILKENNK